MKIYEYDSKTKFFTGVYEYVQPNTGKFNSNNATITPPDLVQGKNARWNGKKWIIINEVRNKGICWDGQQFTLYLAGQDYPDESRLATEIEKNRLGKPEIWSYKNKDGNPIWTAAKVEINDRPNKLKEMNISCQNWICPQLGITPLDEMLYPDKKAEADKLANSKEINDKWEKYREKIETAQTLADLDFEFEWSE